MYIYIWRWTSSCMHVCGIQRSASGGFSMCFEAGSPSGTWSSLIRPGWLDKAPQRFIAPSQCWYYKKTLWCPSFVSGFLGKHFNDAAVPPPSWVFVYEFILHFLQLVPKEKFQNYFKPQLHYQKNVWFYKVRAASHSLIELSQWGRALPLDEDTQDNFWKEQFCK